MTPIQHLERLYAACRKLGADADFHDQCRADAEAVAKALMPKPAEPDEAKKP